ncbi:MAG: tetraacyldisaccharide 4'-kinase [Thiotrichales bacterium]
MFAHSLTEHWYRNGPVAFFLLPLSALYCTVAGLRRRQQQKQADRLPAGVNLIVVGNISVGGTGKTPMVIWLAEYLRAQGYKPGIVSRGYGGKHVRPQLITASSDAREVGDESVVIARRTECPVWVCRDRRAAIDALTAAYDVDIIISDDGMQHYRMHRDLEIAMIDGGRRFGNGLCLPSGPLREKVSRLEEVDFRVVTGSLAAEGEYAMEVAGNELVNLRSPSKRLPLSALAGVKVNAVAGLGNPSRFFYKLESAGLEVQRHVFSDHHRYTVDDFRFDNDEMIVMTEKDAVKCSVFAESHYWYIPVKARPDPEFVSRLLNQLKEIERGQQAA